MALTDWENAGLPCIYRDGYSVQRDEGLVHTPFESMQRLQRRQMAWAKAPVFSFQLQTILDQSEVRLAEDFLDQYGYSWFTIPLISDGCLREHEVRLIEPWRIRLESANEFELSFRAQTRISVDAPDMLAYAPVVADRTCCLPDDFQCCEMGPGPCGELRFYHNVGNGVEEGYSRSGVDDVDFVQLWVGAELEDTFYAWTSLTYFPPSSWPSQTPLGMITAQVLETENAQAIRSLTLTNFIQPRFGSGSSLVLANGSTVQYHGTFYVRKRNPLLPGRIRVRFKLICPCPQDWISEVYDLV